MNAPLHLPGRIRSGRGGEASVSRRSLIKYFGAGAAALGATPFLAGCGVEEPAAAAGEYAIGAFPGDSYFFDTINLAQKQYAKHGLTVSEHLVAQSGVQGMQLLVAGSLNATAVDTLLLVASHGNASKGKRPMMVGARMPESSYAIIGNKNVKWPSEDASFEEKIRALKGKKVGVTAIGAGSDLQLRLALETAGLTYDDITPLAVGTSAQMIPNLNNDRVDAVVSVQWTSTRFLCEATGSSILAEFSADNMPDVMRNQAVVGLAVQESSLENDLDRVKGWISANEEAETWMLENRADAAKLLDTTSMNGKGLPIAEAYIEHYAKNIKPKVKPMFKAPRESTERMIKLAERFGNIEKGQVTYESLVPEFARA